MMRWLLLAFCLLLHLSWGDLLAIQGRSPDLLLIGIMWAAAPLPPWQAALLGFLAGLGADLAGAQDPLGASALAGSSAAFFTALWVSAGLRLPAWRSLVRLAAILAPLELFQAHLRHRGLDYRILDTSLGLALPVWAYTVALLAVLIALTPGRGADGRR
ncbi:MAG: hypothetical protein Q8O14_10125 [bacterium]|jgi:cell shape-determining protein MreD|nr:hypothetical protein [bacterium]